MLKKGLYLLAFLAIIIIYFSYRSYNHSKQYVAKDKLKLETFRSEDGWGYRIIKNGRTFINQSYIPAIPGNHAFLTEEDALRVGKLVLKKVKELEIPSITVHELDSLGVSINPSKTSPPLSVGRDNF
ncbi:hypothetical protein MNBD_BACTEROID01-609 [hydrothermal vent metagenome]|uniref:DUF4907 domain-containing protein n=1 Tax=hydrothermal vent metagenome TaxID=652676 RepID=A0A3B0UPC4_9ZZZZ